jgi:hypothetical protein
VSRAILGIIDELLRAPGAVAARCRSGHDQRSLFVASLLSIAIGAGSFGAVLATSRGGLQLFYSASKLPLVLLATLILVAPALRALTTCFGRPLDMGGGVSLLMAGSARAALVLLALSPVVWFLFDRGLGYHRGVLLAAGCYGFAGLFALELLCKGLGSDLRGLSIIGSFALVLLPTAAQTAWMCRPFLGRPAEVQVPFFRPRESSFADALFRSTFSSVGVFEPTQGVAPGYGPTSDASERAMREESP